MDAALRTASIACAVVATVTWFTAAVTRECSWVDRLWSILPPAYVAYFAYASGWDARLLLMTACATAWGARLTWNFARKGGYAKGGEDYRWAELRKRLSPALFQAFNLLFIAGFQNALLLAITLPAWAALGRRGAPLGGLDGVAALLFASFLVLETVADEEQWRFQQDKKAKRARRADPRGVHDARAVRVVAAPEFLRRAGALVELRALRDRGRRAVAEPDARRRARAHRAVPGLDALHRGADPRQVPELLGLPANDLEAPPPPAASRAGIPVSRELPALTASAWRGR